MSRIKCKLVQNLNILSDILHHMLFHVSKYLNCQVDFLQDEFKEIAKVPDESTICIIGLLISMHIVIISRREMKVMEENSSVLRFSEESEQLHDIGCIILFNMITSATLSYCVCFGHKLSFPQPMLVRLFGIYSYLMYYI